MSLYEERFLVLYAFLVNVRGRALQTEVQIHLGPVKALAGKPLKITFPPFSHYLFISNLPPTSLFSATWPSCWRVGAYSVLIYDNYAIINASISGVKNLVYKVISNAILKIAQPTCT